MPGATFEYTFKRPGTYTYLCNVHPDMTGSISVIETVAAAAPVGSAGRTLETPTVNAAAPVTPAPPAKPAAAPGEAPVRGPATVDAAPAADIKSLGGIALAVLMVSIASALFARVLRGTVRT